MSDSKYTENFKFVFLSAKRFAKKQKNQQLDYLHVLYASITQDKSNCNQIFRNLGVQPTDIEHEILQQILNKYPSANIPGATYGEEHSEDLDNVLRLLDSIKKNLGDKYISEDLFWLGVLTNKAFPNDHGQFNLWMNKHGINYNNFTSELMKIRKGKTVQDQDDDDVNGNVLAKYAVNLTEEMKKGYHDPILRPRSIRKLEQVLIRSKKNNAMLLGEAGVGKTAIVEGLAQKIVQGDVPSLLKDREIWSINASDLVAGASKQGEVEKRLRSIIAYTEKSDGNVILFIDEIQQIIGSNATGGTQSSTSNLGNVLKVPLARGKLHLIGATTNREYKLNVEPDAAFTRRFSNIRVAEPSRDAVISMLRSMKPHMEERNHVKIADDAIKAAVDYSVQYISNRQLPAKALDVMDDAVASVNMDIVAHPAGLVELHDNIYKLNQTIDSYKNDVRKHSDNEINDIKQQLNDEQQQYEQQKSLWENSIQAIKEGRVIEESRDPNVIESEITDKMAVAQELLKTDIKKAKDLIQKQIPALQEELKSAYAGNQMHLAYHLPTGEQLTDVVTVNTIARTIANTTGVNLSTVTTDEKQRLLHLSDELHKRIKGQDDAIKAVSRSVKKGRMNLKQPNKPVGSFLFLGSTGTGKTELAKTLASYLYGDDKQMLRLNMSEYQTKNQVNRLIGAAPGYIGYEEGGVLTEYIKLHPRSVILFDEVEKAYPTVFDILLQVLDDGMITDSKGTTVDCSNTIIIMTSNLGAERIFSHIDKTTGKITEDGREIVLKAIEGTFRNEFIQRIDETVIFEPLTLVQMCEIAEKTMQLEFDVLNKQYPKLHLRLQHMEGSDKPEDNEVYRYIADSCRDRSGSFKNGARPMYHLIDQRIVSTLANFILADKVKEHDTVDINIVDAKITYAEKMSYSAKYGQTPKEFSFEVHRPSTDKVITLYESEQII